MLIIRRAQTTPTAPGADGGASAIDPLGERAVTVFAAELAADRVPSIRAIRTALHVGQPRAQRLRECLTAAAEARGKDLAA
jgi:hypothetical protein